MFSAGDKVEFKSVEELVKIFGYSTKKEAYQDGFYGIGFKQFEFFLNKTFTIKKIEVNDGGKDIYLASSDEATNEHVKRFIFTPEMIKNTRAQLEFNF